MLSFVFLFSLVRCCLGTSFTSHQLFGITGLCGWIVDIESMVYVCHRANSKPLDPYHTGRDSYLDEIVRNGDWKALSSGPLL